MLNDLITFSHLRWDFVFQRPQHLLTRCARERRVFFWEEPLFDSTAPRIDVSQDASGVVVVVPHLLPGTPAERIAPELRRLLDDLIEREAIARYVVWYYTPMALSFTEHLTPHAVVYDCMDELSAFAGAPAGLSEAERRLLQRADLVITGGASLFEAKRRLHPNVHAFPSSVDVRHFASARSQLAEPSDQIGISRPRLGYFGVIDERIDFPLLAAISERKPAWQLVMVGPFAKIDPAIVPRAANIHYLGQKPYADLPAYIAGWDVALLPFARNDATRFISPTKTPEYLAAGKPVVSTPIADVVSPYGDRGIVRIAGTVDEFISHIESALTEDARARQAAADALLAGMSWDSTWAAISVLLRAATGRSRASAHPQSIGGTNAARPAQPSAVSGATLQRNA